MDDKVPAIQGKMGGYTYYSFSIEPEKLLKIGYVLHRSEANKNMMPTYQRLIKKKRLQEVRSFVNDGGYFPNSIIISIDTNGKGLVFDQSASKVDSTISKIGILHIPKRYRSAYIIDGQHRLYGYSDSLYAETNTIPVVAFVDLERSEQIKLFMDINENQKAVPKSLRVTLNADMLWESPDFSEQRQALRSKIAQMLGEESTSPLNSRIVIGENESTPTRCITVEAIQSALKKCKFFDSYGKKNVLQKEGTFDCKDNQETCDLFYPFIEKCLLYIRETCLDEWDKGDQDSGMLTMNRGIQAVIRVIDDVVNMLVEKGMIQPKTQALDDMFGLIQYYLKPLTDYINNLNAEQRKDLRGYFGGGADTRFWRAYQKAIADMRPDFVPDGLEEFWQNETKIYNEETKSMLREIESKVKLLISERLGEYFGDSWLIKGLPKNIYTRAKGEADEAMYVHVSSTGEEIDIPIWDYVTLPECKQITMLSELINLLQYRFEQIDFIDEPVDLGFDCPLDLHCTYTRDQLLVALDFMKPATVREGVKWLPEKNIDVFFVTLNKADKDYSPTTMYNDYSINESLFHWQSQSTTAENSPTGQRYIHHKERGSKVLLFVREFKSDRMTGGAEAYTYLGTANYVKHTGSRPMNITWQLDRPIPAKFLKKTNKLVVG